MFQLKLSKLPTATTHAHLIQVRTTRWFQRDSRARLHNRNVIYADVCLESLLVYRQVAIALAFQVVAAASPEDHSRGLCKEDGQQRGSLSTDCASREVPVQYKHGEADIFTTLVSNRPLFAVPAINDWSHFLVTFVANPGLPVGLCLFAYVTWRVSLTMWE